jgi:hypothetical protein
MSGYGDEIRKLSLDPKVREAIAEIADSTPYYGGGTIKKDLEGEVKARAAHAQGRHGDEHKGASSYGRGIGRAIMDAVDTGDDDKVLLLEKQLNTIVESQVHSQYFVHDLLLDMADGQQLQIKSGKYNVFQSTDNGLYEMGSDKKNNAFEELYEVVQKGVDAAIDAPLKTPPVQEAPVKKR